MFWIRVMSVHLGITLSLVCLIACEEPVIPVNEVNIDAEMGGIGPISVVGGEMRGGEELAGELVGGQSGGAFAGVSGIFAGDEAGITAGTNGGGEAGDPSGGEVGTPRSAWEMSSCRSPSTPVGMVATDLSSLEVSGLWKVGGPIGPGALLINPRGEAADQYQLISLIGGRVEMRDEGGTLLWQTVISESLSLQGIYDLDGDGALEVVVRSRARVHVLSVANGVEVWRSDPQFDLEIEPITSVSRVLVDQAPEEPLPYLYVADAGCSSAGTGYGVIYRFPSGFTEAAVQPIAEPRLAGRCARWHTLSRRRADTSEDLVEVMITDAKGLHAFNASTGARSLCGALAEMPPAGELPYQRIQTEEGPGWIVFLPHELALLTPHTRMEGALDEVHCAPEEAVLRARWRIPMNGLTPFGSVHLDHTGDGVDDLWVNALDQSSGGHQRAAYLIDGANGETLAIAPQIAILGLYQTQDMMGSSGLEADLLIAEDPDTLQPLESSWFHIQLARFTWSAELASSASPVIYTPTRLWPGAIDAAQPLWSAASVNDTQEHLRLMTFDGPQGLQIALKRDQRRAERPSSVEESSVVDAPLELILINASGGAQTRAFSEQWGVALPTCASATGCRSPQRLALSLPNGQIEVLDTASLASLGLGGDTPVSIPTGKVSVAMSSDGPEREAYLITQSSSGQVTTYRLPARAEGRTPLPSVASIAHVWSRPASQHGRPDSDYPTRPLIASPPHRPSQPPPYEERVVVTYDRRDPSFSAWVGYELVSGEERWRHQLFAPDWRSEEQTLFTALDIDGQRHHVIFRLERMLSPDALDGAPACSGAVHVYDQGDLFAPYEACPELQPTPRVIHALEATTGRCLWRTTLRARNGCARPSLQHLSLADANGDGQDELYLLESDSIRVFDPVRGTHEGIALIPRRPDQRLIAGGWLKAHQGGLLRFGTYSPPDLYQLIPPLSLLSDPQPLDALWFGQSVPGLRNQSWLTRWAEADASGVWMTLGVSYPLALFNNEGQITALIQLTLDAESESGVSVTPLDASDYFAISPEITSLTGREGGGLIAATREGGLFVLDSNGALAWGRRLRATPSLPEFIDWDRDGEVEWLLTTSDGELAFYDQQGYTGVTHVWEADCDIESICSTSEDIDELEVGRRLCIAWAPLDGASGVELQLQTASGTALSDWSEPYEGERAIFDELQLTPGNRYRVAARARITDDQGGVSYTETTYSDGFIATDDLPPEASLVIDPEMMDFISNEAQGGQPAVMISLSARDRIGIAGWSLVVYSETGRFVRLISSSIASGLDLNRQETWDGRDRYQRLVPPGRYIVIFGVTDTGGNQVNVEAWVTSL